MIRNKFLLFNLQTAASKRNINIRFPKRTRGETNKKISIWFGSLLCSGYSETKSNISVVLKMGSKLPLHYMPVITAYFDS